MTKGILGVAAQPLDASAFSVGEKAHTTASGTPQRAQVLRPPYP